MNDKLRLALMSVVAQAIPVLQLVGVLPDLTTDEIALVVGFVNQTLLVVAFFWKDGQETDPLHKATVKIPVAEGIYEHPDPKGVKCVTWITDHWDGSPARCTCGSLRLVGQ